MKKLLTFLTLLTLFFGVGWAETKTDILNYSFTGIPGTGYSEWSGKQGSSSSAVYAGYTAGANNSIQLRSNGNQSGIISTTSGGKITKVLVSWNNATGDGRTLQIYGKNSAYTSTEELYNTSTQGTLLGTIVYGSSVSLNISGDYAYIGLRSASGAMYLTKIEITWEEGGSTVETVATPTFSPAEGTFTSAQNVTIACATSGATIHYTTDGNTPTASSTTYSSAIPVSETTTIKAIAVKSGMNNSDVATATYTINSGGTTGNAMIFTPSSSSSGTLEYAPTSSVTASMSGFTGYTSGQGAQRTKNGTGTITFSNLPTNYTVKKIVVSYTTNSSSGAGTISATLNGNSIGNSFTVSTTGGTTPREATLYDSSIGTQFNGNLVISTEVTTNSVYIYKVLVYYEAIPEKAFNVTVTQPAAGGTISASPSGEKVADEGDEITLSYEAAAGYQFGAWDVKDASNNTVAVTNNKFTMPSSDVTVTASFNKIEYNINRSITAQNSNDEGGSLGDWTGCSTVGAATSATGYDVKATYGSTVQFKAGNKEGYKVLAENVTAEDADGNNVPLTIVSSDNSGIVFSFTMPASDVSISAYFTFYRPTVRLAGRFNGNTGWRTGDTTRPEFAYNGSNDKYTLDVYFTGEGEGNYFFLTADSEEKHPNANGNWVVSNTSGTATALTWGSSNFEIANGVYTIELAGDLSTIAFTKKNPTITFSPGAGEVEQGTTISATSDLTTMIAAIKATDSGAAGTVTVGVNTDNGNTWNPSETLSTVGSATVYGKAYIGNINATGTASYTVVAANTSMTYQLITSTNDLEVNKKYLLVCESGSYAYKGGSLGEAISIDEHETTLSASNGPNVKQLIMQSETISGTTYYNFSYNDGGATYYLANTEDTNNGIGTENTLSDAGRWVISSINSDKAVIVNKSTGRYLRAYSSGTDFRSYGSETNQTVQLYKQTVAEVKDYTITYAEVTGGSATGADGANEGETVTVTVTASEGYAATGISVNPSVEVTDNHDGTYTFTMPASNVTVTPSFAQAYDITYVAEPAAGGIVTGVPSAIEGSTVVINVTPNADYQISSVVYSWGTAQSTVNVPIVDGNYQITMPGSATTVTATFVKVPHSITVVSSHGDVTGLPATATSGTSVTFTVTPNAGYVVSSVTGTFNGGNSSLNITDNGDGTYTFNMPASDVAITVTYFASEDYELLTDLADINAEDTYLIVGGPAANTDKVNVMGKATDNSTMGYVALTTDNYVDGIITSSANMAVVNFLVGTGDNAGKYALHTSEGYITTSSVKGTSPYYMSIELNDDSRAFIGSHFSYNSSSPRWKYYTSQPQGANYIFKLANKNKVKRPTITGTAGEFLGQYNFIGKDNVSMACATDGATIEYSLDGGNTWQSYSEAFEISTDAAGKTVDVMARATKNGMEPSDAVTATFTCIKPTAPTFGTNEAGAYVNPVFVYPKSALKDRRAYGEESVSFCYTTDGTDADASSPAVATSNSNGYYIVLDDDATLSVVTVINGIASDPAGGEYTFSVDAPAFSLAGGSYDGNQQTRLSTNTKTQQNNLSWNTVIYYTTGNTEFEFNATTGEVTSEGWIAYDPTNSPYIDILAANGTTTIKAVTLSNYFNGQSEYRASDVTTETYVLTAANLGITISPAAGTYVNAQNVTLGVKNNIGDYIIYYTTDGSDPNTNGIEYTGTPITVDHDMTIKVYAVDSRSGDGGTATAEAVYKIGIQPVVYSPFPGTIYKGDDEDINVEMFSVTPNAKIYYTVAEGEDNYPDDPTTASTLYSTPVPLETGKTYNFKAIAVVGNLVSTVTPGTFTVQAKGSGWLNVKEMNEEQGDAYKYFDNPVQVVYMSTWRHNGEKPEFAFVRDNSGYGMVYFGGSSVNKYNDYTKYQMGDWLPGGSIKGQASVWSDSFINELGNSSGTVSEWPETALGNTAILPEETTNKAITDGWTYEGAYNGTDYASHIDPDKNLFGHYVHLRKNTISNLSLVSQKYLGQITDQSGVPLNYYDGLYLFSGHNGRPKYDQTFFDQIQNNGGTFDVYAIVYFYGPNAHNAAYSNAPYEIFPIDFEWIYKPLFNIETGTYYEPQTISLTCETEGAQIWYKTSEMEAYELYTGPFEVDATTTIESYSTLPSKYNDVLESVINSITVTIGTVEAPVITEQSVVKTVGESVTTDITCTTEGATIYYTTDGSDPKTSETRIEYTLGQQLTFDETTTVRAIAMQDGYYSVEAESRTYTFVKSNGIEYTLVTNVNQLNENSVYVIVNKANNMAMSTNQKTNNRGAAGVMFKNADKTIVYGNDDLAQFTLKKTGNNWYIQTNNSSSNGYLSVGNGNTLLTSATPDGNAEATINIDGTNTDVDKANEAHISFIYNNETTRFMRYWNRDHLFNTYTTETNAPVFLYYKKATPLATIEKEGINGNDYTVADELVGVYASGKLLWCKDQGNVSINKSELNRDNGEIDFLHDVVGNPFNTAWEDCDQSNWVILDFSDVTEGKNDADYFVNKFIAPATVTGTYNKGTNYTIKLKTAPNDNAGSPSFTKNIFVASNFAEVYQAGVNNRRFLNPKGTEVHTLTFAVWDGTNFTTPSTTDLPGVVSVDWTYNKSGDVSQTLVVGTQYEFIASVGFAAASNSPGLKAEAQTSKTFKVQPLNLTSENVITGINTIAIDGSREVKSVKYVNVAGMVSDKPFSGVNIVVTEYTDGSRSTTKMLHK